MALPLSYTRAPTSTDNHLLPDVHLDLMGGAGFEPAKALPSDLQSDPFDHSGNPPGCAVDRTSAPANQGLLGSSRNPRAPRAEKFRASVTS